MSRISRFAFALVAFAVVSLSTVAPSYADAIQLTSFSQLAPGGITAIYPEPELTELPSPYTVSAGGNALTFTHTGSFVLVDEDISDIEGPSWFGNFPRGTRLLYTGNALEIGSGPLTIDFANGVAEFGFQAENDDVGFQSFSFTVFNGSRVLGTFGVIGFVDESEDGTSPFLGARATGGDVITRVTMRSNVPGLFGDQDFAIGPVTSAQPVPEPTTMLLLGTGLAVIAVRIRRSRRATGKGNGISE
ncbi:MAG: PEP-CTERM sorting domain-containing protein [Acidobacteriota bacterium]|nr:PEP-CTERM sorting domain-containing protein [Acidobacteriota bacterium]